MPSNNNSHDVRPTHRGKVPHHLPTVKRFELKCCLSVSSVRDAFLRSSSEQVNAVKHRVGRSFWFPCTRCLCFVMTLGFLANGIVRVAPARFIRTEK